VIVVSNNDFNNHSEDVIVLGVTSNIKKERYAISLTNKDLDTGNLFTDCVIKVENILRLEKGLIIKKIGTISEKKLKEVHAVLDKIIK
jgi:mRNA-degrading endonuclease toxin of MazEF toxin-antitoxin module